MVNSVQEKKLYEEILCSGKSQSGHKNIFIGNKYELCLFGFYLIFEVSFQRNPQPFDFEIQDTEGVKNIDSSERQLRLFGLINGFLAT